MRRQNVFVGVIVMALLSACIVAPPPTTSEQPSEHEHAMGALGELGTVDFPVPCTAAAQTEFNHGVALLHSFWFAPAIQSFTTVTERDPTCAMGHWGIAMSLLGNPFAWPPSPKALEDGWTAVGKATAAGAQTPREAAYIAAVAAFYQDAATVDHRTRALAYEQAMAELASQYPEDTEATIFYALALDATALPTDKTYANQLKAVMLLEQVFAAQPNHPGVAHYLIHSNDSSVLAGHGLDAAQRYAGIAPAAPHALHMPSHIFTRLGLWQESIDTNIVSAQIANDEIHAALGAGTGSVNGLHAMDYLSHYAKGLHTFCSFEPEVVCLEKFTNLSNSYLMHGYLQLGQDQAASQLLDELKAIEQLDVENFVAAYALAALPARYALERGQWTEASALALHPPELAWEKFPQAEAVLIFANGLGAARGGDVAAAGQALDRLQVLSDAMLAVNQPYFAGQAEIQSQEIAAWVALAEGNNEEALTLMRSAAALEDATDKHPVTPGPFVPAHELLGGMLLALDEPGQALQEFEASQQVEPNRFRGLAGAARAAELAGEMEKARTFYEQLVVLGAEADGERPELAAAQAFLAQ